MLPIPYYTSLLQFKKPKPEKNNTKSHVPLFLSIWSVSEIIKNPQVHLNFLISCIFTYYFLYYTKSYSMVPMHFTNFCDPDNTYL